MRNRYLGIDVGGSFCDNIYYIIYFSDNREGVQDLLYIVNEYEVDFNTSLSGTKSGVIVIGENSDNNDNWNLADIKIDKAEGFK